jgi:hypothetical protein
MLRFCCSLLLFALRMINCPITLSAAFLSLKLAGSMDYNHTVASHLIKQNVARLLAELPDGVEVVAAAKTRTPEEVLEAVQAGIEIIGENYVKEAKEA